MHIDQEIGEVERRIASSRGELERILAASRRSALDLLASPACLAIAAGAGFLLAGGLSRRSARAKAASGAVRPGLWPALAATALSVARSRAPMLIGEAVARRLRKQQ